MFNDVLSILTYPTISDHGDEIVDWSAEPTSVDVAGCDAQPGPPQEVAMPRADLDRTSWTVWCPAGTPDILDNQQVEINGAGPFRQVGLPQLWQGTGPLDGPVIYLERWPG
jgi:hypothetical protein